MLGDEKMRRLRNMLKQAFHPCQYAACISFDIFLLSVIYDIVKHDYIVVTYPESVVLRSEGLPVCGRGVVVTLQVLLVVMVPDDRIERNPGLGDGLPVGGIHVHRVPAYVTQRYAHSQSFFLAAVHRGVQVRQTRPLELGEMLLMESLRIGYGHNGVVLRVRCHSPLPGYRTPDYRTRTVPCSPQA